MILTVEGAERFGQREWVLLQKKPSEWAGEERSGGNGNIFTIVSCLYTLYIDIRFYGS